MNNCIINGITECHKMSVGGIQRVWIIPFDDIYNYTYTDDELGKVTGFNTNLLPVEYAVIDAQFDEEYIPAPYNNYVHSLSFAIPKLTYQKRNELEKLAGSFVTILFKDKNGKCWITGFDAPLKFNRHRATTGGDASQYSAIASGNSRYQVKECICFDSKCFASFNGQEFRTSIFTIETASIYNFGADWQIVADTATLDYTPNQALDPVNWSNPTVYAQDLAELTALVGNPSTSIVLDYDGGTDTATITLYSNDTSYDYLVFAEQTAIRSAINITLNLTFVLTPSLNVATTTITITDGDSNVVYSGSPDDTITGSGLSGTVSNALIDVTQLYADGTTFTATIENAICETKQYVFVYENLVNCDVEFVVAYNYGVNYEVSIEKNPTFNLSYQQVTLYYDEWQFNIIADISEATDDFATFEAAVLAKLTADPNCPIIPSSITVTEGLSTVTIAFESTRRNSNLYAHFKAAEAANEYGYLAYSAGEQTNLMNVQSLVPSNSYITIINSTTTDELGGQFGNAPDLNEGYSVEDFDDTPGVEQIENIAFDITQYVEEESWSVRIVSPTCPTTNNTLDTAVCFEDAPLSITRRYHRFVCDVAGNPDSTLSGAFVFAYSLGLTPFAIVVFSNAISNNIGTDGLSVAVLNTVPIHLGDNPIKVLNFRYDPFLCNFTLELDCHTDVNWDYIEGDRSDIAQAFTLIESYDITGVEFDPIINPHTNIDWLFNDVDAVSVSENAEALSTAITRWRNSTLIDFARFFYDTGLNEFMVSLDTGVNQATITFEFWDINFVLLEQFVMTIPTTTDTFTPSFTVSDCKYVSISSTEGGFWWVNWDSAIESDANVFIPRNVLERNIWGRLDRFSALTPLVFTPSPVVTSILCP